MSWRAGLGALVLMLIACDPSSDGGVDPSDTGPLDAIVDPEPSPDSSVGPDADAPRDMLLALDSSASPDADQPDADQPVDMTPADMAPADMAPPAGRLESRPFTITQTWSQEADFERRVLVEVPPGDGPHPVLILLHGNGGNARGMINGFREFGDFIRVAPDGYARSWNIRAEESLAPDVDYLRQVIGHLRRHSNVAIDDIAILGTSNGSALTNRLLIELEPDTFRHAITIVSPLNHDQYDDTDFLWDPTGGNAYDTPITPAGDRRVLCISGTEDNLIPYEGGRGVAGYVFWPALYSTEVWARHLGYDGPPLEDADGEPDPDAPNLVHYRFLDGDVSLIKVVGAGHGAGGEPGVRDAIRRFLAD